MTVRRCTINPTIAIQATRVLEREARQLHESYTVPSDPPRWDCAAAKRDHDEYRRIAKALRAATKAAP